MSSIPEKATDEIESVNQDSSTSPQVPLKQKRLLSDDTHAYEHFELPASRVCFFIIFYFLFIVVFIQPYVTNLERLLQSTTMSKKLPNPCQIPLLKTLLKPRNCRLVTLPSSFPNLQTAINLKDPVPSF